MSHDNFQPPEYDDPHKDDDERMYGALSDLSSLDTHNMNLRDHPKAYEVLDRLMTHAYGDGREDAAAEIARLQAQVDALAKVMTRAYRLLGAINHDWPGRHTRQGQELLCDMRDSIASATNQSGESVQDSASLPLT